jgi:pteridine reductase
MDLQGKVALVTGAARRLGRGIALALAEDGADLVLHRHASAADDTARAVEQLGRRVVVIQADLSTPAACTRFSQEALALAGHVDVVVNNAAVFFPTPLATLTVETWRTMIRTNLTAPFVLALHLGRVMRAQGQGHLIQIGDWSGLRPARGYLPYCVSKGGLTALTQALAKALAPHVHVNSVVLGPILPPEHYAGAARHAIQEQTPLRRLGEVEDVVRAVRFLVNRGAFVTGSTYVVDGGWLVSAAGGTETVL